MKQSYLIGLALLTCTISGLEAKRSSSCNISVSGSKSTSVNLSYNGRSSRVRTNAKHVRVKNSQFSVSDPRSERVCTCKRCAYRSGDEMNKCPRCKGRSFIVEYH